MLQGGFTPLMLIDRLIEKEGLEGFQDSLQRK
jgi:hypothetical protein